MNEPIRSGRASAASIATLIVALPPLVLAFGYLMWAGSSRLLYGRNIAAELGFGSLLIPGLFYVGVLAAAAIFAGAVGRRRLIDAERSPSRVPGVVLEVLFWIFIIVAANGLAFSLIYRVFPLPVTEGAWEMVYVVIHVVLLGFGFRRAHGIWRAATYPPELDRRNTSAPLRLLQALVVVLFLVSQVPVALLFGVLGANPAKTTHPAVIYRADHDPLRVRLIERNENRILAFDEEQRLIVRVPLHGEWTIAYGATD
jgi:hypothetical protein